MEDFLSHSFELYKKNIPNSELFNISYNFINKYYRSNSFTMKRKDLSDESSTEQSTKLTKIKKYKIHSLGKNFPKKNLFKKNKIRKDIYGNIIEKGNKYKVSFKDDIKGKFLVEITFYNAKDNCLRRKNYKDYTIKTVGKDKGANKSSGCSIF